MKFLLILLFACVLLSSVFAKPQDPVDGGADFIQAAAAGAGAAPKSPHKRALESRARHVRSTGKSHPGE